MFMSIIFLATGGDPVLGVCAAVSLLLEFCVVGVLGEVSFVVGALKFCVGVVLLGVGVFSFVVFGGGGGGGGVLLCVDDVWFLLVWVQVWCFLLCLWCLQYWVVVLVVLWFWFWVMLFFWCIGWCW